MRAYIKNVLSSIVQISSISKCINSFSFFPDGRKSSCSPEQVTRALKNKQWPIEFQNDLSREATYQFIVEQLYGKDYLHIFSLAYDELEKQKGKPEAIDIFFLFEDLKDSLDAEDSPNLQRKLVATGVHSLLCFLISNGRLKGWHDDEVHQYIHPKTGKKSSRILSRMEENAGEGSSTEGYTTTLNSGTDTTGHNGTNRVSHDSICFDSFSVFAQFIYKYFGSAIPISSFTQELLESVVEADYLDSGQYNPKVPDTYRAYYHNERSIKTTIKSIYSHIDWEKCEDYFAGKIENLSIDAQASLARELGRSNFASIPSRIVAIYKTIIASTLSNQRKNNSETKQDHYVNDCGVEQHLYENSKSKEKILSQDIYKNSCAVYSQLLDKYDHHKIDQRLCPKLDIAPNVSIQIIGGGGSGKTTFLINQFKEMLTKYEADSQNNPLPVYIPLNRYRGITVHGETFIKNYIATTYANVPSHEFDWNLCNYYVMLDGANESPYASEIGKEIEDLVALGCTILVTSRYKLEWNCLKSFSCVKLNDLDDEVIQEVLASKHLPMAEDRLLQTLRLPMWLALYLGIKNIEGINTPAEILREHHNHLLFKVADDIQGEKYTKKYQVVLGNVHRLAAVTQTVAFNENEIPTGSDTFLQDRDTRDEFLSICVTTGLLRSIGVDAYKGGMLYQWGHEHYLDFYRALNIFTTMEKGLIPASLKTSKLPNAVSMFLGELFGEYHYITKKSLEEAKSPLEQWMQRYLRRRKNTASVVRNLVDCMKQVRDNRVTAQYDGLNLSMTNFYNCWIGNSSFRQAVISETTFVSQGHSSDPDCISILIEKGLMASSSIRERHVYIWDYANGQYLFSIESPKTISSIDFSPDGRYLAVMLRDEEITVLLYDVDRLSETPIELRVYDAETFSEDDEYDEDAFRVGERIVFFGSNSDKLYGIWESGYLMCWDVTTYSKHFDSPIRFIHGMGEDCHYVFSPSRESILTSFEESPDKYVVSLCDIGSGEKKEIANNLLGPCYIAYMPDDQSVVYSLGDEVFVVENPYCSPVINDISTHRLQNMAVTPELIYKLSEQWNAEQKRFIRWIDVIDTSSLNVVDTMDISIWHSGICYDAVSNRLFMSHNSCVNIFDPSSRQLVFTLQGHGHKDAKYLIDFVTETQIVRIFEDGRADLFDQKSLQLNRLVHLSNLLPRKYELSYCCLLKNYYFTIKNKSVLEVWDVLKEERVQSFKGDFATVSQVELAQRGTWLLVRANDNPRVYLGNIATGDLFSWDITSKYNDSVHICKCSDGKFRYSTTLSEGDWQEDIRDYPKNYSRIDSIKEDPNCPAEWSILRSVYHIDSSSLKAVIGTYDGQIIMWDIISGKVLLTQEIHRAPIEAISLVPGTNLIVSIARNGETISYDWEKGTIYCHWMETISKYNRDLCIIPVTQNRIIVKSDLIGKAALIDPTNGNIVTELPGHSIDGYVISENGATIAAEDMSIVGSTFEIIRQYKVFCPSTGECKLDKQFTSTHSWNQLLLSPEGTSMALFSSKGYVVGWNTNTGQQVLGWDFTDVEDLHSADFKGVMGLTPLLTALLRMNGGII